MQDIELSSEAPLVALAVALACGLVIGFERGWRQHDEDGQRHAEDAGHAAADVAGIRTFALTGLLGGVASQLAGDDGLLMATLVAALLLAAAALLAVAYVVRWRKQDDPGLTTEVALLLTLLLGALAGSGRLLPAVACAAVTAAVLGFKREIHATLGRLTRSEELASLQLVLVAAVILPMLPDRAMGPWDSLNPRTLGLLVMLIAGIGFVGYFAVRILGARAGLLLTGVLGGLTSSTAVAAGLGRLARRAPARAPLLGAAILLACSTMGPRLLIEVAAVNRALLWPLLPGMLILTLIPAAGAFWIARTTDAAAVGGGTSALSLTNPLALRQALAIGLVLTAIFVLARAAEALLGEGGVYALAMISGIADADAITLALADQALGALDDGVAARGILLAALVNTAMKAVYAAVLGGRPMLRWASTVLALTVVVTAATLPLTGAG